MSIIERVKRLECPLDQCVVIGSGLLDALGLRSSGDIDLVVSRELFEKLRLSGEYQLSVRHDQRMLERDDVEIWQTWGNRDELSFEVLYQEGVSVDGVRFSHPSVIIGFKKNRGMEKDSKDVALLEEYICAHPGQFA